MESGKSEHLRYSKELELALSSFSSIVIFCSTFTSFIVRYTQFGLPNTLMNIIGFIILMLVWAYADLQTDKCPNTKWDTIAVLLDIAVVAVVVNAVYSFFS